MTRTPLRAAVPVLALALASPAGAKPAPKPRTVKAPYSVSGVEGVLRGNMYASGATAGAVKADPRGGERYVRVSLADESGMPAAFEVMQDTDSHAGGDVPLGSFCGTTPAPLKLANPRAKVVVYPVAGTCGTATRGVATVTFSAR